MRRVILEAPYRASTRGGLRRHLTYARDALRDSLARGEAPLWSPALYALSRALHDNVAQERDLGMQAGWAWLAGAHAVVYYDDLGINPGMQAGIDRGRAAGLPVERRSMPKWRRPNGCPRVRGVTELTCTPASRQVLRAVADCHGLLVEDLRSRAVHGATVAGARHEAAWLLRHGRGLSLPTIARILGGRDHSTIISSLRRAETHLAAASTTAARLHDLRASLTARGLWRSLPDLGGRGVPSA